MSLTVITAFGQHNSRHKGDLNKDGIADLITVFQDSTSNNRAYRLKIYLSQPDGKLKLVLSSDSAIVARYPNGQNNSVSDAMFTGIKIERGTFTISHELIRGSFSHQFRFQHNRFELIGYRSSGVSGRDVEEVDFNLSTGNKIIKLTPIGADRVSSKKNTKQKVSPLPDLKFFEPYQYQY